MDVGTDAVVEGSGSVNDVVVDFVEGFVAGFVVGFVGGGGITGAVVPVVDAGFGSVAVVDAGFGSVAVVVAPVVVAPVVVPVVVVPVVDAVFGLVATVIDAVLDDRPYPFGFGGILPTYSP